MELDKRILPGKRPLTPFDVMESKFIGTDCYLSNNPSDYGDLSNCQKGCLLSRDGMTGLFNAKKNNSYANFNYCLPVEFVKKEEEPKTKYRPFTMNEFKATFNIYKILTLRRINEPDNIYTIVYLGYRQYDESDNEKNHIYLTNGEFSLKGLFNNFEIYSSEGWQPFGTEVTK